MQRGARIGARCKIQSHTFICDGVEIGDEVFVGHGVMFITDLRPAALDDLGLTPALQALARRTEQLSGISVGLHVSLRYADGVINTRLLPDIELA